MVHILTLVDSIYFQANVEHWENPVAHSLNFSCAAGEMS